MGIEQITLNGYFISTSNITGLDVDLQNENIAQPF